MASYTWEGTTQNGEMRKGTMDAQDQSEVDRRLRAQNIDPELIKKKGVSLSFGGTVRVPTKTLVIFTRQFATMIDAGLPIVQCLELLGDAEPHVKFKGVIAQVKGELESGSTLADALRKHPGVFDNLYTSLVNAGEEAGILDTVMNRLAIEIEKSQKLKRKVKGAFTYPIIVLVIAVVVVIGLLYKVIPTFTAMFAEMGGGELPLPTRIVMAMSDFIQAQILTIVGGTILAAFVFRWLMKNPTTRAIFDKAILKAPLFGPLIRKSSVARFTRTLGTMVSSGVPIVDSLEIVAQTSGNMTIEGAILYVKDKISEGQNMVDPLLETDVFPSMVVQMIGVGESTGALDTMLNKIADFYEDEVDMAVENLTALLEPILMVFLGGIVGGILIAMYMPIFSLAGSIKT